MALFEETADIVDVVNMSGRALCVLLGDKVLEDTPGVEAIRRGAFGAFPHIALLPDERCAVALRHQSPQAGVVALTDWSRVGLVLARLPCARAAPPPTAVLNAALEERLFLEKPALLVVGTAQVADAVVAVIAQRSYTARIAVASPLLDECVLARLAGARCADAKRCARCSTVLEWRMPCGTK